MAPPPAGLLELSDAVEKLLASVQARTRTEEVALADALGRVLATEVTARVDVPAADNSAMDGYALRASDGTGQGTRLPVSQRIFAGNVGSGLGDGVE